MKIFRDIDTMRERLGVSQRDLCNQCGVNPKRYSLYKSGSATPSDDELVLLTTALEHFEGKRRDMAARVARLAQRVASEAAA